MSENIYIRLCLCFKEHFIIIVHESMLVNEKKKNITTHKHLHYVHEGNFHASQFNVVLKHIIALYFKH